MSREVRRRSAGDEIGGWAARVGRGVAMGGGLVPTVQRLAARRPVTQIVQLPGANTGGLTSIAGTSSTPGEPAIPEPVDAASITDGLWIIQGDVTASFSGGTGNVRARLVTSALSPISDWYYDPDGDDTNARAYVPAHFAVFGDTDAARLQFEAIPASGSLDSISAAITGYLLGS